jgi:hypothetical protein
MNKMKIETIFNHSISRAKLNKMNKKGQVGETITWVIVFIIVFVLMIVLNTASPFVSPTGRNAVEKKAPLLYKLECIGDCIKNEPYDYCCIEKNLVAYELDQLAGVPGDKSTCEKSRFWQYAAQPYFQTRCVNIINCEEVTCIEKYK